jgi:hypothetical protein
MPANSSVLKCGHSMSQRMALSSGSSSDHRIRDIELNPFYATTACSWGWGAGGTVWTWGRPETEPLVKGGGQLGKWTDTIKDSCYSASSSEISFDLQLKYHQRLVLLSVIK